MYYSVLIAGVIGALIVAAFVVASMGGLAALIR